MPGTKQKYKTLYVVINVTFGSVVATSRAKLLGGYFYKSAVQAKRAARKHAKAENLTHAVAEVVYVYEPRIEVTEIAQGN